jgi:hypothetical protein
VRELARTPRWIAGALFCLAGAAVCAFLGVWQWNSAESLHGTLQNLAYAFNWWLFAALFIGFWFKALRDTVRRDAGQAAGIPTVSSGLGSVPNLARLREPAPDVPRPPIPTAEEDPDVAAWNRWLAELNANPSR